MGIHGKRMQIPVSDYCDSCGQAALMGRDKINFILNSDWFAS